MKYILFIVTLLLSISCTDTCDDLVIFKHSVIHLSSKNCNKPTYGAVQPVTINELCSLRYDSHIVLYYCNQCFSRDKMLIVEKEIAKVHKAKTNEEVKLKNTRYTDEVVFVKSDKSKVTRPLSAFEEDYDEYVSHNPTAKIRVKYAKGVYDIPIGKYKEALGEGAQPYILRRIKYVDWRRDAVKVK